MIAMRESSISTPSLSQCQLHSGSSFSALQPRTIAKSWPDETALGEILSPYRDANALRKLDVRRREMLDRPRYVVLLLNVDPVDCERTDDRHRLLERPTLTLASELRLDVCRST